MDGNTRPPRRDLVPFPGLAPSQRLVLGQRLVFALCGAWVEDAPSPRHLVVWMTVPPSFPPRVPQEVQISLTLRILCNSQVPRAVIS